MVFNLTDFFNWEMSYMFRFHLKKYVHIEIKNMSLWEATFQQATKWMLKGY
jgi:hypothetical protein